MCSSKTRSTTQSPGNTAQCPHAGNRALIFLAIVRVATIGDNRYSLSIMSASLPTKMW